MGHSLRSASSVMALLVCSACSKATNDKPAPAPAGSVPVPGAAATPKAQPASAYAVLARAKHSFVVNGIGAQALAFPGHLPMRLDGTGLHEEGALIAGLGDLSKVASMSAEGSFPDAAFLDVTLTPEDDAGPGPESIYAWHKTRWVEKHVLRKGERLTDMTSWKGGRYIAVIRLPGDAYDYRFALLYGKVPVALPNPGTVKAPPADKAAASVHAAGGEGGPAEAPAARCRTPLVPMAVSGSPDGHLFLLGNDCLAEANGKRHLVVERWSPDSTKGTIDQLPAEIAGKTGPPEFGAVSANEAYLDFGGSDTALARFDGTSWKMDKLPPGKLNCFGAEADGAWVVEGKKLYHRGKDGQWRKQTLPRGAANTPLVPIYTISRSDAIPWVVARDHDEWLLLGAKRAKPTPVVDLPDKSAVDRMFAAGKRGLMPASAACGHLFVLLQSGVGAGQKTFKVLDTLKGKPGLGKVQIVTDDFDGQLLLGAVVPDMATGQRVVGLAKAKSRVARMACHAPKVKKTLAL